jgi:MFS family permease
VEGRDLSSRQTQYVVKDLEIGKPINSENCSEAADGVARESVKSCPRAGWIQAGGLFLTAATHQFEWWLVGSILLGLGTAMVYPSLIAAVSDASHPTWRARSLSVYRFWRDLGYAIGALSAGLIADRFGLSWAIASIAALTFLSGAIVAVAMRESSRP